MKRVTIAILFFSIALQAYTQTEAKQDSARKWRVGAFVNNGFEVEISYEPEFIFSGGIKADYNIFRRFAIQTGIEYFRRKYNMEYVPSSPTNMQITDFSYFTFRDTYNYIELPLSIKFYILKKNNKIQPYFATGLINQFAFYNSNDIYYDTNKVYLYDRQYKGMLYYLNWVFAGGIDIRCNDRLFVDIGYVAKNDFYGFYYIGIATGVKYAF